MEQQKPIKWFISKRWHLLIVAYLVVGIFGLVKYNIWGFLIVLVLLILFCIYLWCTEKKVIPLYKKNRNFELPINYEKIVRAEAWFRAIIVLTFLFILFLLL